MQGSPVELILQAGWVVKSVLVILLVFSVVSWTIIFYKYLVFHAASKQSVAFLKAFQNNPPRAALLEAAKALPASPLANVYRSVAGERGHLHRDELRRLLRRYEALESARLHAYLTFLATTGSTAPFIGLFGTVWGIMDSFGDIGAAGSASLAVVAPGIAEALIATAVGLAAAIPAVIGYNYYLSRARKLSIEMEDFSEELLDALSREPARARA